MTAREDGWWPRYLVATCTMGIHSKFMILQKLRRYIYLNYMPSRSSLFEDQRFHRKKVEEPRITLIPLSDCQSLQAISSYWDPSKNIKINIFNSKPIPSQKEPRTVKYLIVICKGRESMWKMSLKYSVSASIALPRTNDFFLR